MSEGRVVGLLAQETFGNEPLDTVKVQEPLTDELFVTVHVQQALGEVPLEIWCRSS